MIVKLVLLSCYSRMHRETIYTISPIACVAQFDHCLHRMVLCFSSLHSKSFSIVLNLIHHCTIGSWHISRIRIKLRVRISEIPLSITIYFQLLGQCLQELVRTFLLLACSLSKYIMVASGRVSLYMQNVKVQKVTKVLQFIPVVSGL